MEYQNIDKKLRRIRENSFFSSREDLIYKAIRKWEEAKQFYISLLNSKRKNVRKDLNYKTRNRFFISLDLIEKNPKRFIKLVDCWFKNRARYDLEGVDGGILDDDVFYAYVKGLRGRRKKEVLLMNEFTQKKYKKKSTKIYK